MFQKNISKNVPPESLSVIIAARNEERNLQKVIGNLREQEIKLSEVIIVDDYSNDFTFQIAEELSKFNDNVKVIRNYFPQGKKNSLTVGINDAASENILITDADCLPQKSWAASFASKFSQGYELLFGIAPYINTSKIVTKISSFENLRAFILSVTALYYGIPYSAAARSFGFKKSSFSKLNGYAKTMEIPYGDDGLLIREAFKHNMKIGFVSAGDSFVFTMAKENLCEYLEQRKRHTTTSFYYSFKIKFLLAFWHILNLIPIILIFLIPLNPLFIIPLTIKLAYDSIVIIFFQKRFGYYFKLMQILYHQLLYEGFLIIHFFNALTGKVKWK